MFLSDGAEPAPMSDFGQKPFATAIFTHSKLGHKPVGSVRFTAPADRKGIWQSPHPELICQFLHAYNPLRGN
jgi:hypothetical protein